MEKTLTPDEIFRNKLENLGNEAKRRLIELLAASMIFSDNKEGKDDHLFYEICGAWSDDGLTAEQEIEELRSARTHGISRNIIDL
jgi:hypothetical protein